MAHSNENLSVLAFFPYLLTKEIFFPAPYSRSGTKLLASESSNVSGLGSMWTVFPSTWTTTFVPVARAISWARLAARSRAAMTPSGSTPDPGCSRVSLATGYLASSLNRDRHRTTIVVPEPVRDEPATDDILGYVGVLLGRLADSPALSPALQDGRMRHSHTSRVNGAAPAATSRPVANGGRSFRCVRSRPA